MPAKSALHAHPYTAARRRACPQCTACAELRLDAYSAGPWDVVQCDNCRFVYLANPPDYRALISDLAWEKTSQTERDRRRTDYPVRSRLDRATRWRLSLFTRSESAEFAKHFAPGRVLDIGCGRGRKLAANTQFVPFGIEISEAMARDANEHMTARGGQAIHAPAVEGIGKFPDRYFSGVLLRSVLEHESQPKPLLREVARVMDDEGAALIRVPNFGSINRRIMGARWCGFRHPDHVNYFTPSSLRCMAADCGLHLKLLNAAVLPFDDNIKAVLVKA